MTLNEQVAEFHVAAGQPNRTAPTIPDDAEIRLRARLIAEEFFETMAALFPTPFSLKRAKDIIELVVETAPISVDLVKLADGLGDLDYVVEGTRLHCGIPGQRVADEIHRSNMAKFGPGSRIREDGKVLKPPGWTPPDIEGVLRAVAEESLGMVP